MNNTAENLVHLKAILESDSTIDKVRVDVEHEALYVTYNGKEYYFSVRGDRECAAIKDVAKRLIQIGNIRPLGAAENEYLGE